MTTPNIWTDEAVYAACNVFSHWDCPATDIVRAVLDAAIAKLIEQGNARVSYNSSPRNPDNITSRRIIIREQPNVSSVD